MLVDINFPELIIGTILGLLAGYIMEYLTKYLAGRKEKDLYAGLEGIWVERIENQEERRFSIARFSFDKKAGTFHYNGNNYNNDSTHFYRWRSEKIFKDQDKQRLLYIYSVSEDGKNYILKEGFGVSYFDSHKAKWTFTHGYFLDADLTTKPRNLKFIRATELAQKLSFDLGDASDHKLCLFVSRLIEYENKHSLPVF